MAEFNLMLNEQERTELLRLLKNTLREHRVCRGPSYAYSRIPRKRQHEEDTIRGLLQKVQDLNTGLVTTGSPERGLNVG